MDFKRRSAEYKKLFTLAMFGLVCTACSGDREPVNGSHNNVALHAPRAIILAGIPADSLDLQLTVDNSTVEMQQVGAEQWTGTVVVSAGQPFNVNVVWATQGIELAVLNQTFAGVQSNVGIIFKENEYRLIDTDDDTYTNIDEIIGSSDVEDPNSIPGGSVPDTSGSTPVPTDDPVTPPVTDDPVTPPVTDDPVTPPVTDDPVTPPVTDDPVTPPVTDDPVTPPVTDDPVTPPVTDDPVTPDTGVDPNLINGNIPPDCSNSDCSSANADWFDNTAIANNRSPVSTYTLGVQLILFCLEQDFLGSGGTIESFADGQFGAATELALRLYQVDRGLLSDGVVGPETWSSLQSELNDLSLTADGYNAWTVPSQRIGCENQPMFYQQISAPMGWALAATPGDSERVPFSTNFLDLP